MKHLTKTMTAFALSTALLTTGTSLSALVVDSFDFPDPLGFKSIPTDGLPVVVQTHNDASILGGNREIRAERLLGVPTEQNPIANGVGSSLGLLYLVSGPQVLPAMHIDYDGAGIGAIGSGGGMANILEFDFTLLQSDANFVRIDIAMQDSSGDLMTWQDDLAPVGPLALATPETYSIPFASFTSDAGFDINDVTKLSISFNGFSPFDLMTLQETPFATDIAMTEIRVMQVPEPMTYLSMSSLLGVVALRRKKKAIA